MPLLLVVAISDECLLGMEADILALLGLRKTGKTDYWFTVLWPPPKSEAKNPPIREKNPLCGLLAAASSGGVEFLDFDFFDGGCTCGAGKSGTARARKPTMAFSSGAGATAWKTKGASTSTCGWVADATAWVFGGEAGALVASPGAVTLGFACATSTVLARSSSGQPQPSGAGAAFWIAPLGKSTDSPALT